MTKVLLATLYEPNPVLRAATQLSVDKLILIVDEKIHPKQEEGLKIIKESLGRVMDVRTVGVPFLDVVGTVEKIVETIDSQDTSNEIIVNITAGIKTVALGTLYACFSRVQRISKITYNPDPEHKSAMLFLPKMAFRLSESQRKVLDMLHEKGDSIKEKSLVTIAEEIQISRAMLYKNIDEMRAMDLVSTEKGLKLTDAGKIARL